MPGLKPEACNGDITLNICYKPSLNERCLFDEKLKNECDYGVDMDTQEEEVKANFYRGSKEVYVSPWSILFVFYCEFCL